MNEQPQEWTLEPVKLSDGTSWVGVVYISDGKRKYGSMNEQEAIGLIAGINAALAAEREKREHSEKVLYGWRDHCFEAQRKSDELEQQLAAAEQAAYQRGLKDHEIWMGDQLAAERELREKAEKLYHDTLIVAQEQAQQLAAEREKVAAAYRQGSDDRIAMITRQTLLETRTGVKQDDQG
jgi:hypothetical protein